MRIVRQSIFLLLAVAGSFLSFADDGLCPAFPNLQSLGDSFSFAVFADPQVGHKDDTNPVPVNARRTQMLAIEELGAMETGPAFAVFLGDLVNVFDEESVSNFEECISGLKAQPVLVHGNHDTHAPYTPFRELMKRVCGFDAVYYSFDAGRWHFIVLPCNLPGNQPEAKAVEAAMLEWLDNDLQKNHERPTMVFEHLHALPQGLTQLEWYNFPLALRLKIMDRLTRYGNVRYYLNGHVHNGIKTSVKTSWRYKGIDFINVPTIIRSRNFGEEYPEFQGGQDEGGYYLTVEVRGTDVAILGHLAGKAQVFRYPVMFREFREEIEPRWFHRIPELAAVPKLVNGEFSKGLRGWNSCYRYACEAEPGFISKVSTSPGGRQGKSAYVLTRAKEPPSWANDEMMEIYQMVSVSPDETPVLRAKYYLDQRPCNGGGYVRMAAIKGTEFQFMMMFKWGENERDADITPRAFGYALYGEQKGWTFLQDLGRERRGMFWNLPAEPGTWHSLVVNIAKLYDEAQDAEGAFSALGTTKVFLGLGTWTNKQAGSLSASYFDQLSLRCESVDSEVDGKRLECNESVFKTAFGQALADREMKRRDRKQLPPRDCAV